MTGAALQYGDVGEWVFGLTTIGALVWAVVVTRSARDATRDAMELTETSVALTKEALELERDKSAAAQAALVSCAIHADREAGQIRFDAWNHSQAPIFEAKTFVVNSQGSYWQPADPWRIEPGDSVNTTLDGGSMNWASHLDRLIGMTFRDNAGVNWIKWADGKLAKLTDLSQQIASDESLHRASPSSP